MLGPASLARSAASQTLTMWGRYRRTKLSTCRMANSSGARPLGGIRRRVLSRRVVGDRSPAQGIHSQRCVRLQVIDRGGGDDPIRRQSMTLEHDIVQKDVEDVGRVAPAISSNVEAWHPVTRLALDVESKRRDVLGEEDPARTGVGRDESIAEYKGQVAWIGSRRRSVEADRGRQLVE